jgi:hypothetical protein
MGENIQIKKLQQFLHHVQLPAMGFTGIEHALGSTLGALIVVKPSLRALPFT